MRIRLIGTGLPTPDPRRAGPCSYVEIGGKRLLVDCGDGTVRRLMEAAVPAPLVDGVLLTHLHSDHTLGLPAVANSGWVLGRDRPLAMWGPPGTQATCDGVLAFLAEDIAIRKRVEFQGQTAGISFDVTEIGEGTVLSGDGWAVEAFLVHHPPIVPSFGFRFVEGDGVVVFSGDTAPCDSLVEASRGSDVLVHECMPKAAIEMARRLGLRQGDAASGIAAYHTNEEEVGVVAQRAGARTLVLNHLPPVLDEAALTARIVQDYSGELRIGADLDGFEV